MHLRTGIFLIAALAAIAPLDSQAAARKDGKAAISFHLQAGAQDNPKMIFPETFHGRDLFFSRMPEFTHKDIASFRSFPCENEAQGYGVILYLKPQPAKRLNVITNANREKWLCARVNGRAVDAVIINDQVSDGILVIWRNITLADIVTIEKAIPRANAGN